jgi:hypothetical protein
MTVSKADEELLSDPVMLFVLAKACTTELTKLLQAGNFQAAIEQAGAGIKLIEPAMATYSPEGKEMCGPSLFEIYAYRAMAYGMTGNEARAVQDVKTAMAMPAAYQNAQLVGLLQQHIASSRPQKQEEKEKCFIATAAYGSALAPEDVTLRQFRDVRLRPKRTGRLFVRLYERYSPPLAEWIAPRRAARAWVQRLVLVPIVWLVRRWTA